MAILEHELRFASEAVLTGLHRHLLARDEYDAMVNAGAFKDSRIELIEGEIVEMAPIGDAHAALNDPIAMLLRAAFGNGFTVRTQAPIALGDDARPSAPQPDVTVALGHWQDYLSRKPVPNDICLVLEIADTTLSTDRSVKAALYGSAGITEYWIVNLNDRQIEAHRTPCETGYTDVTVFQAGGHIEALRLPGTRMAVSDFLP